MKWRINAIVPDRAFVRPVVDQRLAHGRGLALRLHQPEPMLDLRVVDPDHDHQHGTLP
jgi:hypothetical protein